MKCVRDGENLNQVLKVGIDIDLEILFGVKMKHQVNRGKTCKTFRCNNKARVKGLCNNCYQKNKVKTKV